MKTQLHKIAILGLFLGFTAQMGHSAAIKDTHRAITSSVVIERQSPIEKALLQQKQQKRRPHVSLKKLFVDAKQLVPDIIFDIRRCQIIEDNRE